MFLTILLAFLLNLDPPVPPTKTIESGRIPLRLTTESNLKLEAKSFPQKHYLPEKFLISAAEATKASEVVHLDLVIPLEDKNESILGKIKSIVLTDNLIIVIDHHRDDIFKFSYSGAFQGRFAEKGSGPGNFQEATYVTQDKHGNIILLDGMESRFHAYAKNGAWLYSTPRLQDAIILGNQFIWQDSIWYQTWPDQEGNGAWAKIDFQGHKKSFEALAITRFSRYLGPDDRPKFGFGSCAQVGQNIWIGSPFASQIRIYDQEGILLTILDPPVPHKLNPEIWKETNFSSNKDFELFRQTHTRTLDIFSDSGLVWIQQLPYTCQLYDESGASLTEKPLVNDLTQVVHMEDGYIYLAADQNHRLYGEAIRKVLGTRQTDFENPVLLRLKLKGFH